MLTACSARPERRSIGRGCRSRGAAIVEHASTAASSPAATPLQRVPGARASRSARDPRRSTRPERILVPPRSTPMTRPSPRGYHSAPDGYWREALPRLPRRARRRARFRWSGRRPGLTETDVPHVPPMSGGRDAAGVGSAGSGSASSSCWYSPWCGRSRASSRSGGESRRRMNGSPDVAPVLAKRDGLLSRTKPRSSCSDRRRNNDRRVELEQHRLDHDPPHGSEPAPARLSLDPTRPARADPRLRQRKDQLSEAAPRPGSSARHRALVSPGSGPTTSWASISMLSVN